MADYAIGTDGNISLPGSNKFNAKIRSYSASISRATADVTGFGDTGVDRRASSTVDITGSASGIVGYYSGSGGGGVGTFTPIPLNSGALNDITELATANTMTLTIAAATSIAFNVVMSGYAFGVTQTGDTTITYNFEMNDHDGPAFTWDEQA